MEMLLVCMVYFKKVPDSTIVETEKTGEENEKNSFHTD